MHSFAEIKIKNKNKPKEAASSGPQRFAKYQRLRWIIIDECSTASVEVLATLEKRLSAAVRDKGTWKLRGPKDPRPFGGLHLVVAGDFWQFPAVKATSLFHNPFAKNLGVQVQTLLQFFWNRNNENMNALFELTKQHRCQDPWLSAVLAQGRHGNMTQEVWSFLHGLPTLRPGSWNPSTNSCSCRNAKCQTLTRLWEQEVQKEKRSGNWHQRQSSECSLCQTERARRCVVAGCSAFSPDPHHEKFLEAPFVHGLNAAKYVAALLRAKWVANEQKKVLLWAVAQDRPLFSMEPGVAAHELQLRKEGWLQRHDQSTGGIIGLLPMLPGMPVRITQTLPDLKPFSLFKNTRGQLWGWALDPVDLVEVHACKTAEHVLKKLPVCLFVKIANATWQHKPGLPQGVACLRPMTQHWKLENQSNATVARRGFPLACDYAGTAHSFMGATLSACSLDLGFWDSSANRDGQLSAYMCLSRVKRTEDLCVARPFSPQLLCRGFAGTRNPLAGPPKEAHPSPSQSSFRQRDCGPQTPL